MPTFDQWRTTDLDAEKAMADAERASETCAEFVAEEIAALPDIIGPWREDESEPGNDDAVVSQYRFWLTETVHREDSPANRRLFEGVLHERQLQEWEDASDRSKIEARWSR